VIFVSATIGASLAPVMTKRFGKKRGVIIIGVLGTGDVSDRDHAAADRRS